LPPSLPPPPEKPTSQKAIHRRPRRAQSLRQNSSGFLRRSAAKHFGKSRPFPAEADLCGGSRAIAVGQRNFGGRTTRPMCGAVGCGAVRCGAVRCGAVRCGAVRCGAVRCGAVRCGAVRWKTRPPVREFSRGPPGFEPDWVTAGGCESRLFNHCPNHFESLPIIIKYLNPVCYFVLFISSR
jgi:hypothetical protein